MAYISLRNTVFKMMRHLEIELKKELQNQGHKLTGKLIESIRFEVEEMHNAVEGVMFFEDYYVYMEYGTKPDRIPYGGRGGTGRTSKYIEALIKYWKLRGKSDKVAKSAAFATAKKQKQEGMPTKNSFSFSKNNRRTGFVEHTLKTQNDKLIDILKSTGQEDFQKGLFEIMKENLVAA